MNAKSESDSATSDIAVHPSGLLAEELEARGMTQAALAEAIDRPPRLISALVRGKKPITATLALELERALGIPALFWVRQQARYDLYEARQLESATGRIA